MQQTARTWTKGWTLAALLVLLACGGGGSDGADDAAATDSAADLLPEAAGDPGGDPSAGAPTYTADVQPIWQRACAPCHTTSAVGGTSFGGVYGDNLKSAAACPGETIAACSLTLIRAGQMPKSRGCTGDPAQDEGKQPCLTAAEIATLEAWIAAGLPE